MLPELLCRPAWELRPGQKQRCGGQLHGYGVRSGVEACADTSECRGHAEAGKRGRWPVEGPGHWQQIRGVIADCIKRATSLSVAIYQEEEG